MAKKADDVTGETAEYPKELDVTWYCPACRFKTPYVRMPTCPTCERCGATMRTRLEANPNVS